ncbi:hypothetical protein ABVK25_004885 [Lepraria finkii]|uniref:Uncharacterized protein n=1 Tax=Lepraria finkii TaxID=1340010 RepID=A0ABR4B9P1_9LECA
MEHQFYVRESATTLLNEFVEEVFERPSVLNYGSLPLLGNDDMGFFKSRKVFEVGGKVFFAVTEVCPEQVAL